MRLLDLKHTTTSEYRCSGMETQEVHTCLTMPLRPRRAAIRIHEDSLFKRTEQVVFPSDKNFFVRRKPLARPQGRGISLQSRKTANPLYFNQKSPEQALKCHYRKIQLYNFSISFCTTAIIPSTCANAIMRP